MIATQESVRPAAHIDEPPRFEDFEGWVYARSANWQQELREVYGEPATGRHRATFVGQDYVLKVPRNSAGIADNTYEASVEHERLAWAFTLSDADGFPLLVMEKVVQAPVGWLPEMPRWTWSIDCGQVGYSKRTGRLVAFDYGPRS